MLSVFAVLNLFAAATIPAVLTCWPFLEPVRSRLLVEAVFSASLLYVPAIPFISILSAYDALRVSMDDTKKDTLLDRILLAVTRFRMEGWLKAFRSPARALAVIALLFALLATAHHQVRIPASYYSSLLGNAQAWFHEKGMTMVPDLIGRILSGTVLAGK